MNDLHKRLRYLKRMFLLLSSLLALVACGGAEREEQQVDLELARRAAEAELVQQARTGFPAWNGASLGDHYSFHDLRGAPTAYMFICKKGGQAVGYVTVSASKRFTPIFESSTNSTPPASRLDKARLFAQEEAGGTIKTEQLIFLGSLSYYVKYTMQGEQEIFVNLSFPGLGIENAQAMEKMQRSFDRSSAKNAEKAWNTVLAPNKP